MFLGSAGAPHASNLGRLASGAFLELIVAANVAKARFWKLHGAACVLACAPLLIDAQEVLAYLLADVLDRPLLPKEDTRSVGQCAYNGAAKAKNVLRVKAKKEVEEACWRALQAKPTSLASQLPYDLKLPQATVGQKRTVVQWAVRDELAAGAKASKATARKASAGTEYLAAIKHSDRKNAAVYETLATCRSDRAEHPDTALGIAEAAHERYIAASTEK